LLEGIAAPGHGSRESADARRLIPAGTVERDVGSNCTRVHCFCFASPFGLFICGRGLLFVMPVRAIAVLEVECIARLAGGGRERGTS